MSGHYPTEVTNYRLRRNNLIRKGGQHSRRHFQIGYNNMINCIGNLNNLLSTISKVPSAEVQVIPNHCNNWVGSHTDFSLLITKPALYKSALTAWALKRQLSLPWTIAQSSSKEGCYTKTCILQYFSKGLIKTFVKNIRDRKKTEAEHSEN